MRYRRLRCYANRVQLAESDVRDEAESFGRVRSQASSGLYWGCYTCQGHWIQVEKLQRYSGPCMVDGDVEGGRKDLGDFVGW